MHTTQSLLMCRQLPIDFHESIFRNSANCHWVRNGHRRWKRFFWKIRLSSRIQFVKVGTGGRLKFLRQNGHIIPVLVVEWRCFESRLHFPHDSNVFDRASYTSTVFNICYRSTFFKLLNNFPVTLGCAKCTLAWTFIFVVIFNNVNTLLNAELSHDSMQMQTTEYI